jgi:ABC-type polysaccharide/polyol phosphate transport system ATPase subunit
MTDATDSALSFQDVSYYFRVPTEGRIASLKEWTIRRVMGRRVRFHRIIALDGVTFQLKLGRALGVIGHNGAGKSTLLRIAAGILQPLRGTAIVQGRIAPVIELGFGLEHELTGRENIIFNGALLGRSHEEMTSRMDEIVAFAELGEFINNPIRTYSTGMVARLAFSVATTVDADVLLLDEVLAVGDESFQMKCLKRMSDFRARGVSILYVSHDLNAVEELCDEALWIEHGRVVEYGPTSVVVPKYRESVSDRVVVGGAVERVPADSN